MRFLRIAAALAITIVLTTALDAQSLDVQLQRAVQREIATGDSKAAAAEYRRIADRAGSNRAIAAQALLRLAEAYRNQGDAEAAKVYQQIVSRFGDQTEIVSIAQTRLAAARASASTGIAKRHVWFGRDAERAAGPARISWDGRFLAFVPADSPSLVLRDLNGHTERTLVRAVAGQDITSFAWSRDSEKIALRLRTPGQNDEIRIVSVKDAASRLLVSKPADFRALWVLDWAPDGRLLIGGPLETDRVRLAWINSSNGAFLPLAEFQSGGLFDAQVSPDGTTVVFGGIRTTSSVREIRLIASDASRQSVLSADPRDSYPAGWLPDNRGVLVVSRRAAKVGLWAIPVSRGAADGEARLIEPDLCSCGELVEIDGSGPPVRAQAQVETLGVTATGTVYFRTERVSSDIYLAPVDPRGNNLTATLVPLKVSRNGNNIRPQWSPDGRRILLLWNTASQRQLSIVDVANGSEQRLSGSMPGAAGHCWAGNEAIQVFQRPIGTGPSRFTRVNLATREETVVFDETRIADTSCSADGRSVGYSYYKENNRPYFRVRNLSTGSVIDVPLVGPADATTISPDGRLVAFSAPISRALFVAELDGGAVREIVKATAPQRFLSGTVLAWSPDSQYVYYVKEMNGTSDSEVFRVRAAGGPEERLGISGPDLRNLSVSPDGTQIALAMGPRNRPEIWAVENLSAAIR